jgi:hypothetical protein
MNHRVAKVRTSPPPNKTVLVAIAAANGTPADALSPDKTASRKRKCAYSDDRNVRNELNSMYQPKLGLCGPRAWDKKYGVATASQSKRSPLLPV